jgi:hypothetical protein
MRFSDHLRKAGATIWEAQHVHPFVRGLDDGSLDLERFKAWVRQDYLQTQSPTLPGQQQVFFRGGMARGERQPAIAVYRPEPRHDFQEVLNLGQKFSVPRYAHVLRSRRRLEQDPRPSLGQGLRPLLPSGPFRVSSRHLDNPSPPSLDLREMLQRRDVDATRGEVQGHPAENFQAGRGVPSHQVCHSRGSGILMRLEHESPHPTLLRDDGAIESVNGPHDASAPRRVRIQMRVDVDGSHERRVRQSEVYRTSQRIDPKLLLRSLGLVRSGDAEPSLVLSSA